MAVRGPGAQCHGLKDVTARAGFLLVATLGDCSLVAAWGVPGGDGRGSCRRGDCLGHSSPQEPLVHVYPVVPCSASSIADDGAAGGGLMVAVRAADLATPLGSGALPGGGDRSALVVGGTERIRTGDVSGVPARWWRSRRRGCGGTGGCRRRAARFTTRRSGLWRTGWRSRPGPGSSTRIAERAVLRPEYVKGERERLLARAFMIRVDRADDPDAGRGHQGRGHRAGRGPGPGAVGAGLGSGVGAGARGLAERARPGAAGGTAGHRAGGVAPGARGPGLAGGRHRPGQAAEGVVAGRDADPGAGHPGEPGGVRLGRHRRRLLAVPAAEGAAADGCLDAGAAGDAARPGRRRTRPPPSRSCWTRPWSDARTCSPPGPRSG